MAIVLTTAIPLWASPLCASLFLFIHITFKSIPSRLELLVLPCAVPSSFHVSLGSSSTVGHWLTPKFTIKGPFLLGWTSNAWSLRQVLSQWILLSSSTEANPSMPQPTVQSLSSSAQCGLSEDETSVMLREHWQCLAPYQTLTKWTVNEETVNKPSAL